MNKPLKYLTAAALALFCFTTVRLLIQSHVTHCGGEWARSVQVPPCRADQNIEVIYPASYAAGASTIVTIECNDMPRVRP